MQSPEHENHAETSIAQSLRRLYSDLHFSHNYMTLQESVERYVTTHTVDRFSSSDVHQLMNEQSFTMPFPSELLYEYDETDAMARARLFLYDVLVTNQEPQLDLYEVRTFIPGLYNIGLHGQEHHTHDTCTSNESTSYEPCEFGECPPRFVVHHTLERARQLIYTEDIADISDLSTKRAFSNIRAHLTECARRNLILTPLFNDTTFQLASTYQHLYEQ